MLSIKYSNQAKIDIEDAISYIAKDSIHSALNYLSGYEEKIEMLLSNPYMGVVCEAKNIKRDCRVLVYKSHLIIYRINEEKNELFIIRIHHASEDYINRFIQEQ